MAAAPRISRGFASNDAPDRRNMTAPLFPGARFIGQRLVRKEDGRLLTGRGTFVDDVVLPGLLHVAFVRSPIARGSIRSIDASAASALAGVRAIYTGRDLEPLNI